MKFLRFLFLLMVCSEFLCLSGQIKSDSLVKMDTVYLKTNVLKFKKASLFDAADSSSIPTIGTFKALTIFNGIWDKQCWKTENEACLKLNVDPSVGTLNIKWDKIGGGCNWIGIGFGWDQWRIKAMGDIIDSAAIVMHIKTDGRKIKNIPLAIALEDYAGTQSYLGFQFPFLKAITPNSAIVEFPLKLFPIQSSQIDINFIKQFIIQLEAEGSLQIEKISVERI